jgi:hypothetical protein
LGWHDPTKARCDLGLGWTTVFTLRAGTARPKNFLDFRRSNPFGTKHDRLGPAQPGPARPDPIPSTTHKYVSPGERSGRAQMCFNSGVMTSKFPREKTAKQMLVRTAAASWMMVGALGGRSAAGVPLFVPRHAHHTYMDPSLHQNHTLPTVF